MSEPIHDDKKEREERHRLECLREQADVYCKGEDFPRVMMEDLCEKFLVLADEKLTGAQSAGVERSGYVPFSREEIEDLRPDYGAPMVADVRASDMRKLCDMASNALLYAEEIQRLRTQSATGESYDELRNEIVEECAEAIEGSGKERQPTGFYASVIRALKNAADSCISKSTK